MPSPHHRTEVNSRPQVLSETSFAANSRLSQIKEKLTVEVVSAIDDHLKVRICSRTEPQTIMNAQAFHDLQVLHEKRGRFAVFPPAYAIEWRIGAHVVLCVFFAI